MENRGCAIILGMVEATGTVPIVRCRAICEVIDETPPKSTQSGTGGAGGTPPTPPPRGESHYYRVSFPIIVI